MLQFRPISRCNFLYKCHSTVLASRLKAVLPNLISSAQNAFVKERQITDSILMMHEVVRGYRCKRGNSKAVIKVDLMKAYDTVDWSFLFATMRIMGFPEKFICWIVNSATSAHFSINLNGSLVGYFPSKRGLSQGDPLSSYLFLIAMEVFTGLL